MRNVLGLVTACVLLVGCGGGSGGSGLCQQIGNTACAKACACRTGGTCAVSQGGFAVDFNSESDCRGFFVTLGCAMGDKSYQDAVACLPLVQAATCTGTGADGALSFPPDTVCQAP